MATDSASDEFDWVSAQTACTTALMFRRLLEGARKDVDRRNASGFGRRDRWTFKLHADDENTFEVTRDAPDGSTLAFVAFEREGPRINVTSEGTDAHFTAIVNINPAGECRFLVGETEYLAWEVRKMALEVLFFEEQEEE